MVRPACLQAMGPGWMGRIFWALGIVLGVGATWCGAKGLSDPTKTAVPPAWRNQHPWGPQAFQARLAGNLPLQRYTPQMACWADFGRRNFQEGDLLFRRGRGYISLARLGSCLVARLCDSPFSHVAVVVLVQGNAWVYDMGEDGLRKMPFEVWMLDTLEDTLAVKRLKPLYKDCVPQVLAFLEEVFQAEIPFDFDLALANEKYYCTELVERAFESAGLSLSSPVPIRCLPHYKRYSWLVPFTCTLTEVRVREPIYVSGNQCYGIYSSPLLDLVYQHQNVTRKIQTGKPPVCGSGGKRPIISNQ